jgi:beta-phosphoglucomutase
MIKTVIFDMDGVIVDTEPVHHHAYIRHFEELNIEVDDKMYNSFIGSSTKNIYKYIKEYFQLPHPTEELIGRKRELFNVAFEEATHLKLIDGVLDLIRDLHKNQIQLIVASSSAHVTINAIFKRFNLDQYFSYKVSGEDFPQSKPNPAIFNKAVELSGHQKNECIIIEDSANGIKAANAADVFVIGYKGESLNQDYSLANKVISHFNEISFEEIQKINPVKI